MTSAALLIVAPVCCRPRATAVALSAPRSRSSLMRLIRNS